MGILSTVLPTVQCESSDQTSTASTITGTLRSAVAVPESELKRWRRIFDANAKVISGEKYVTKLLYFFWNLMHILDRVLDPESFVNAIAPADDLSKIGRAQFAILFRVADTSRKGYLTWEDFTVFETVLKRPDADYWMAFQFFDV